MKFFVLALVISMPVFAQDDNAVKAELLQDQKKMALANIDKRISNLNEAKGCINSAQDGAAMKKCHEQLKASTGELKEDMREQGKGMRAKRDDLRNKKREEAKAKREEMKKKFKSN